MGLPQPTNQNEEQKKLKLHARDDGEDDTSYPSEKKCGKHVIDLLKEKPALKDFQVDELFDFECYTSKPATSKPYQVYKNLIIQCKEEIQICERALDEASKFFKIKFEEDLEQKQPGLDSFYVIETVRGVQHRVRRNLDLAIKHLPTFEKAVENYLEYRDGPLSAFHVAKNQYSKKIDEFVEIPNIERLIKCLLYNKDFKEIEHCSGLTQRNMNVIIFSLRRKKGIMIRYEKENKVDEEEQYDESEIKDLLIEHKDNITEICLLQNMWQTAKDVVDKYLGSKYSDETRVHLCSMRSFLKVADTYVRIMRNQLEVLQQKDVILNGCETNFDDDWNDACSGRLVSQVILTGDKD